MYHSKRVFVAACIGLLLFGIVAVSLGSVLPEIVIAFQASELAVGILTSLLPASILVGSLFFGPIADRYGYKGLLLICCFLVLIGLEGIVFGRSWEIVQLSVILIGCGGGALNGTTNALVSDISEGERAAKLSLLGIFYGIGAILMPILLATLSRWMSRETIFIGIGIFILLIMLYISTLIFPKPKQQQGVPLKKVLQLLTNKTLLLFSAILFFQVGMENVINNWITSFLQSKANILPQMALIALTIHMASLTGMRLVLSRLLKRFQPSFILIVSISLSAMGCFLLWQSSSYVIMMVALMFLGIGFSGTFPIIFAQIGNIWSDLSGTAFSIVLALSLNGGVVFNSVMGAIAYKFSVDKLPLLLLACVFFLGIFLRLALPIIYTQKIAILRTDVTT